MSIFKRYLLIGAIPLFLLLSGCSLKAQSLVEDHVRENITHIIEDRKTLIGLEDDIGKPRITFEKEDFFLGTYDPRTDTINIDPLKNKVNEPGTYAYSSAIRTANHEVGHFINDKVAEKMGVGSWPPLESDPKSKIDMAYDSSIGTWLVSEGCAEYFERVDKDLADDFSDDQWPDDLIEYFHKEYDITTPGKRWNYRLIYDGGFHLVYPILSEHGINGLEYLIRSPPTNRDLKDVPGYRNRVMAALLFNKYFDKFRDMLPVFQKK